MKLIIIDHLNAGAFSINSKKECLAYIYYVKGILPKRAVKKMANELKHSIKKALK